jgi:hypothetical protein
MLIVLAAPLPGTRPVPNDTVRAFTERAVGPITD